MTAVVYEDRPDEQLQRFLDARVPSWQGVHDAQKAVAHDLNTVSQGEE